MEMSDNGGDQRLATIDEPLRPILSRVRCIALFSLAIPSVAIDIHKGTRNSAVQKYLPQVVLQVLDIILHDETQGERPDTFNSNCVVQPVRADA